MGLDPARVEAVFNEAVALPTDADRAAYLDRACGQDAALRQRVESLLAAHDRADGFLIGAGSPVGGTGGLLAEGPGSVIGRYKLLEQIGEGGFGVVFMAEQREPVRRKVALKIIKLGMDTRQVVARFEAERQALAMMDHPNIAKVLDGGTTETGRPYFVMELVRGVPITAFCDESKLTPRHRLELFLPVCSAIQHAHQKGIIHRDLKPNNVLVTMHDDKPVPMIIDFGIAKATQARLTDKTLFTEFRQFVGTPAYMSPEQAQMSALDVDTRSDVYSLGVLLYELLTGATPFDPQELRSAAHAEMQRIIREVEPPTPSHRWSTLAVDTQTALAARRQCDPKALHRALAGELDWIIMRCLEKDRARRYETASGLGRDLQRYLANETVEACPPSTAYRLRKLLRKHRHEAVAIGAVLIALLLGIIGTSIGLARAHAHLTTMQEAQRQLQTEKDLADANAAKARAAEQRESVQRKQAEAVAGLLEKIFQDLDPYSASKDKPDLRAQLLSELDKASASLDNDLAGDPAARARLRGSLGWTKIRLGQIDQGLAMLQGAATDTSSVLSGNDSRKNLLLFHLGVAYGDAGDGDQGIKLLEQVRDRQIKELGSEDPDTLKTEYELAKAYKNVDRDLDAMKLLEQVRDKQIRRLGPNDPDTLRTGTSLGDSLLYIGRFAESLDVLKRVRDAQIATLGPDHPDALSTLQSLATAYIRLGRTGEAIALLQEVKARQSRILGPEHPDVLVTENQLGLAYLVLQRYQGLKKPIST